MKEKTSVILPGSYDPVTLGHLDVIRRASEKYESVYAVVFINSEKKYRFSLEDRVKMLILATEELDNVIVSYSLGYVVDYMREHGIEKIVKGYRNDSDLEYEREMARYNLCRGGYETEFLLADEKYTHVSSTLARQALDEGLDLSEILPRRVISFIENR
jgi:pantetheine-phosphate adenylyltransferase